MDKVLIIAGAGNLPVLLARAHKKHSREVSAIAFEGETSNRLHEEVDDITWIKLGSLDALIKAVASKRIQDIVLAGKIEHRYIFTTQLDKSAEVFFKRLPDARAENILKSLAEEFIKTIRNLTGKDVRIIPVTTGLENYLAPQGNIGGEQTPPLTPSEIADINLGKEVAKKLAELDCGQTVVIKNGVVVALEGVEGTDETIKRGGMLCGKGFVVVKVARPRQDMRFDVPVVGENTIKTISSVGGRVLAVEAGKTLILMEKDEMSRLFKEKGVAVVGI